MLTVSNHTFRPSSLSIRRPQLLMFVAVLLLELIHSSVAGAQARARVSPDIAQRLRNGDGSSTRVIMTASRQRIEAVAARHGLRVRKWLTNGASVEVPAGFLARVAADGDVTQLSGDLP